MIDAIGGDTLLRSVKMVKDNGAIISLPSPEIPEAVKVTAAERNVRILFHMVESKKQTIEAIAGLLKNGHLKPVVYKTFSFAHLADAHREVETGHVAGKVVVVL